MTGHEKKILQVFIILALSYVYCDGYCNQANGLLTLVGVFDFNDISSLKTFENAISRQNSVRYIECVPKLTYQTLIVKNETSVQELMDLVDTALQGGPCFMIYASENINARIVLDIATHQGLNIITAVEEVSIFFPIKTFYCLCTQSAQCLCIKQYLWLKGKQSSIVISRQFNTHFVSSVMFLTNKTLKEPCN